MGSTLTQLQVISTLIEQGWIPLRQMAVLMGYKTLRGIYQRQRGRNAIPTIRISGFERVYFDDVIDTLKTEPVEKRPNAQALISLLQTGLKDKERREKYHA